MKKFGIKVISFIAIIFRSISFVHLSIYRIYDRIRRFYKNMPIAQKLSLSSALIITIVIVLLTSLIRVSFENTVLDVAIDGYTQRFETVSDNCKNLFEDAKQLSNILLIDENVQSFFDMPDNLNYQQKIQLEFQVEKQLDYIDAIRNINQFSSISIITIDGRVVNTNNIRTVRSEYHEIVNDLLKDTLTEQWVDLFPLSPTNSNLNSIVFTRPYFDFITGQVKGYIIIEYNSEILKSNFSQIKLGDAGDYIVIDNYGNIKLSSISDKSIQGEIVDKLNQDDGITDINIMIKDEKYLVVADHVDTINWIMLGTIPVKSLTQKGNIIIKLIYLFGALSIITASLVINRMTMRVVSKLAKLAQCMKAFGNGQLNTLVTVESNDEVGLLSHAFNNMSSRINHLIKRVYDEQRDKRKFEFTALQAQINPHFLYNVLNSVCSLISMKKTDDALVMVRAIGNFYRTALHQGKTIIPIRSEIENIKSYINIQSMRYGNKIEYDINIDNSILDYYIIKFTLQPLVENAIYHGIKQRRGKGDIKIFGSIIEDTINISVQDNGVGIENSKLESLLKHCNKNDNKSFGINSIDQRLKLYFGPEYGLEIFSDTNIGTSVIVSLPKSSGSGGEVQC